MPGRKYSAGSSYRYGFNGKENDNNVKNIEGGQQDYGMRIYDPRVGKFLSVDPLTKKYPWYSPYQFAGNKPIWAVDVDGLEEWMKNQEIQLGRKVQLQTTNLHSTNSATSQQAISAMQNQPILKQGDNSTYARQRDQALNQEYNYYKNMNGATMDPLAAGMVFPAANAVGQMGKSAENHLIGTFQGYSQGNFCEGTKNLGLFALDVVPFIPFKGAGAVKDIFTVSIETRGLAEEFALTQDIYKGSEFFNANITIQPNNPVFDLYSFKTSTMVDVTTTSANSMNISGLYKKLDALSSSTEPYANRILQVYVPSGRFTKTQLETLEGKLAQYIKDYKLNSNFRVTEISSSTTSLPALPAAGAGSLDKKKK